MGAELEKGRNLLAETSGGQIRKGPKPLATLYSQIQYWMILDSSIVVFNNTRKYWKIKKFQYCKNPSIVQYCARNNTGFPVLSNIGIGFTQRTILV